MNAFTYLNRHDTPEELEVIYNAFALAGDANMVYTEDWGDGTLTVTTMLTKEISDEIVL